MNLKEHSIVVVEDSFKERFIEQLRKKNELFDVNIIGLEEFTRRYYFDYTCEATFYICKHYGVVKEVAEVYLENLYYIKDDIEDEKLTFLKKIREDLDEHDLLIRDPQFRKYLKGKTIVLYELDYVDDFYADMFEQLRGEASVTEVHTEKRSTGKKPLYRLANREEEIAFVASEIASLLKSGIAIDNIKLANVSTDYTFSLKRTFEEFNIPLELPNDNTISGSLLMGKFKELYESDISITLEKLKPFVKNENDEYVYKKILATLNEYYWCTDYRDVADFVFADLAHIKGKSTSYKHAVRTIDIMHSTITDADYIFLMNFNQGSIPVSKKDEDYLSDSLKVRLGLSSAIELNKKQLDLLHTKICSSSHLTVTYAARDLGGELYISNAYDENLFTTMSPSISFEHSDTYNRRILLCAKDENKKYGTKTDTLQKLLKHYKDEPYATFDNSFKGIDKESLKEFLEGKLTLSYSSMNTYYKCSFRYYLSCILRIDKFKDSFATVIGNIYHEVLSKCFSDSFDFESSWQRAIEHQDYVLSHMENFYLGLLKEELIFIIENIKKQSETTNLDRALFEQKIVVPLDEKGDIVFKGFVDKILYNLEGDTKVAAIIDYKTGQPELNIDNIIYGLDMQLPIYAYLLKHFDLLAEAEIGGFYLQKILNATKDVDAKTAALKLQGYSNSNPRILGVVDKNYEDSSLIRSMKMSKGNFYTYAKVLNNTQIEKMIAIVEERIEEATQKILDGLFEIDPKEIGGDNVGCLYCTYRDICYVKNANIKKLAKMKKEDFLGGEEDGLD